ncbi:phosphotransferase family protein [Sphingomonas bisphenolicum]
MADNLRDWVKSSWPGYEKAEIGDLHSFGSGGASSETYHFSVKVDGREEPYVARFAPLGEGIFPSYDLEAQVGIMNAVANAGIPAPFPSRYDILPGLNQPVAIMPFLSGRVPGGFPPYSVSGWMVEMPEDKQHEAVLSFTRTIADLHKLDPHTCGIAALIPQERWGLQAEIDWWLRYLDWASQGLAADEIKPVADALDWCAKRAPTSSAPLSVVWGDCRYGNVIYNDDAEIIALLDWETATVGPAELDLGWYLSHRRQSAEFAERSDLNDLPGGPKLEKQLELYEARLGRPVENLEWYTLFGAARYGVCMISAKRIAAISGEKKIDWPSIRPWAAERMRAG